MSGEYQKCKETQWHDVDVLQPQDKEIVLVFINSSDFTDGPYYICRYEREGKWILISNIMKKGFSPKYWMSLPCPPLDDIKTGSTSCLMNWIPIGDKIPSENENVVVRQRFTRGTIKYLITKFSDGKFQDVTSLSEVTHWMPLPTSPKES